jgi:uncharacterized LabA/DUF88 family protein
VTLLSDSPHDRVMVFIDLRNVLKSSEIPGLDLPLDLYRLSLDMAGGRRLVAAYVFDTRAPYGEEDRAHRMHDRLRFLGFRVVARESYDPSRREQKEVDVAMGCEMVAHALKDNFDVAVVVSGDRDFVPAIQHVQSAGKRVEVAAFHEAFSKEMLKSCDRYRMLDSVPLLRMDGPAAGGAGGDGA